MKELELFLMHVLQLQNERLKEITDDTDVLKTVTSTVNDYLNSKNEFLTKRSYEIYLETGNPDSTENWNKAVAEYEEKIKSDLTSIVTNGHKVVQIDNDNKPSYGYQGYRPGVGGYSMNDYDYSSRYKKKTEKTETVETKDCKKCGFENKTKSKYCISCGFSFEDDIKKTTIKVDTDESQA